jgi:predicted TIM-barrel fold metal-dependent hydrolase
MSSMTQTTAPNLDWLVSVDDHVIEPPHVWTSRVAGKYKDTAPRVERKDGEEYWLYEGKKVLTTGLSAVAGRRREEFSPNPVTYDEMRPGCYDSIARLADMDQAGIITSLCFPSFPRFCGQVFYEAKDKELALACVKAYNDWMIEEWCGSAPGRYIPLVIIPLWDPRLAAKELERSAGLGARGFCFSENPAPLGLPTVFDANHYWDPVFEAAVETEMIVCMHVGSSSTLPAIAPDSPWMANLAWGANRTSGAMLAWLFSGYFQRLPALKIALSEGEIGWIPFFLERAQQVYDKQRYWAGKGMDFQGIAGAVVDLGDLDMHQIYLDHVFGCFIDDAHGVKNLDVIGENNVMIETDYPHSDSTWPHSIKLAQERLAHLPADVQVKLLRGNAERLFRFTAPIPAS